MVNETVLLPVNRRPVYCPVFYQQISRSRAGRTPSSAKMVVD